MNWNIDQPAFEEAQRVLGLEQPVRVRVKADFPAAGKYHGLGVWGPTTDVKLDEPAHHITLSDVLSASMANTALWHEMTHAAQCEDYLEDGDYQAANKGLRNAFMKEMREMRTKRGVSRFNLTADYQSVSFEVEARDLMKNADKVKIITGPEAKKKGKGKSKAKDDDPLRGYRHLWRVDMWDDDKNFVGTDYVLANEDYDAKRWAREQHMQGKKWSTNVFAYPINSEGGE